MTVTVFSKPACGQCSATYLALDKTEVEYTVIDISNDKSAFDFVTETLGHRQAPVVLVHDGHWSQFQKDETNGNQHWAGFRRDKIATLEKLLAPIG